MVSIDFTPSKKQFQALECLLDDVCDFVGYGGSAFSGKSYLMCYWLVTMCFGYPGTAYGLGRKELTTLKKTTLITLFKVFEECNIKPDIDFNYNQQINVITFKNGSQIFLIDTAHKPSDPLYTRLGGYELTSCAIDESAETDVRAIDILFTRTGRRLNDKYGIRAKMLETFNPAKSHVYNRYYKPWRDGTLRHTYVFVKALPSDNPSPEVEAYVKKLIESSNAITIERLVRGNFEYDDDLATLINYDKIIDCFGNTYVSDGDTFITADVARFGSDNTVIGLWSDFRVQLFSFHGLSVTDVAEKIKELQKKYNVANSNTVADEDGIGSGVVDILGCKGFVNNSRALNDENFVNLKSQCYFKLAEKINKGEIYIDCKDVSMRELIIQELEQVKQHNMDKDGKKAVVPKDKVKELIGRSPDFSDTLMMRMFFELQPSIQFAWA